MTENETGGWHHRFKGHEFERTLGDGEGQGSLACCSPRSPKCNRLLQSVQKKNAFLVVSHTLVPG